MSPFIADSTKKIFPVSSHSAATRSSVVAAGPIDDEDEDDRPTALRHVTVTSSSFHRHVVSRRRQNIT